MIMSNIFLPTAILLVVFGMLFFFLQRYVGDRWNRWLGIGAVCALIILRFIRAGQDEAQIEHSIAFAWLIVVTAIIAWFATLSNSQEETATMPWLQHFVCRRALDVACLALLLGITTVLTTTRLGVLNFQNDEYYHVEAVEGYNQTGEPVLWNFTTQEPQRDSNDNVIRYERAWIYSWQVAQTVEWFEWSEATARIPSVAWGLLFIALSFCLIRYWTKDILLTFLTVLTFVFFDQFVFQARIVRMYSMVLVVSQLAIVFCYLAYAATLQQYRRWLSMLLICLAGFFLWIAALTHLVTLSIIPAFFIFLCVEWVLLRKKTSAADRYAYHVTTAWLAVGVVGCLSGVFTALLLNLPAFSFIGIRKSPNSVYALLPFVDLPLTVAAVGLYLVGCYRFFLQSRTHRYVITLSFALLFLFIFTIHRYATVRYILFFVPLILIVVHMTLYRFLTNAFVWIRWPFARAVAISFASIAIATPLSWPSVEPGVLFDRARADRSTATGYGHDFRTAYAYIQNHRASGDALLTVAFRSYYWGHDDDAHITSLGAQQSLTVRQVKALMKEHQQGWIFWSADKSHHLRKSVRRFIHRYTTDEQKKDRSLQFSGIFVYSYTWSDVERQLQQKKR